jgi:hypothetical protein
MAPRSNNNNQEQEAISNDVAKAEIDKKYHEENQKNKITAPFLLSYPEPQEVQDQIINLADLEDPPDEFEIPGLTSRNPIMPNSCALVRFHFWNINPGRLQNGEMRLKAFRKLFYSQDEQHAVRSIDELCDLRRDAGPRLLKTEVLRRLDRLPISRHYPDYSRDTDWEDQRSRPTLPITTASTGHADDPQLGGSGSDSLVQEETPPHLNIIRETLERLLIQLRYRDLEVPESDATSTYRRQLPSEKIELPLDTNHNFDSAMDGMRYISHERGPSANISDGYITGFDCILMAGKFLDAGLTRIDVEELSSGSIQETHAHRVFVNMVKSDFTSPQISKRVRNSLHQFCQGLYPTSFADLLGKVTILRRQFKYTSVELLRCKDGHERLISEKKGTLASLQNGYRSEQHAGFSMQQVLQSIFQEHIEAPFRRTSRGQDICGFDNCNMDIDQRFFRHSMPLRLAVHLPSDISPEDHTSEDIRIKIFNEQGKEEIAVYRWLGGIYSDTEIEEQTTHYRVYWTDAVRGERPTKNFRMYEPRYAQGRVIEGIAPSQRGQIPEAWWHGKFKPVLFYERVLNPNPLDITLAAAVLGDIHHAVGSDQFILQVHEPWRPTSPRLDQMPCGGPSGEHEYIQKMASTQGDSQDRGFTAGDSQSLPNGPHISASQTQSSTYQVSQLRQFNHSDNQGYISNGDGNLPNKFPVLTSTTIGNNRLAEFPGAAPQKSQLSNNPFNNSENSTSQLLQPDTTTQGLSEDISLAFDSLFPDMDTNLIFSNTEDSNFPDIATNVESLDEYLGNIQLVTPGFPPQNSAVNDYSQATRTQNDSISSQGQQQITWNRSHDGNTYINTQALPGHVETTTSGINSLYSTHLFGTTYPSQSASGIDTGSRVSNPVGNQSGTSLPNPLQEIPRRIGEPSQDFPDFDETSYPSTEVIGNTGLSFVEPPNNHYETSRNRATVSPTAPRGIRHPVQTNLEPSSKRAAATDIEQRENKRLRLLDALLRP